jgi:cobalt-zinc-cadmium efflux system outer membrane protein
MKRFWKQVVCATAGGRAGLAVALLVLCGMPAINADDMSLASGADAAAARSWTLDQLVEELKHGNPQLEQARQAYLAAKLLAPQVSAEPGAQLSLLEQANTGGPFDFNRNSGFYAYPSFTQPFLWPGKLRLAGEIAHAQAEVTGRQYDSLLIQLVAQLKQSFYQLIALQDQLNFMDEDLQRLQQIKEVSKVRYANNAAAYVDFLNAQVSASSLENDRFALQKQIQQQAEQINNLLGHPSQTPLKVEDAERNPHLPAAPLAELIELAQKTNPVIAGGTSQIEVADKGVALAHKAFLPDFSFNVGAYTDPSLVHPERSRMYSVGVNMTLPTWGFRKEKAGLDQARALLDEAKAGQTSNLQQVDLEVANAYHGLETALRQIQFTRERLLPQAQMAYRLALSGYGNNGGTAFSDLLTAQSSLRSTELSLVQAQNNAVQAYIGLAASIGKDPD